MYDSDFDIAQVFGEVGFPPMGLPATCFGDYVENIAADSREDGSYLFGANIEKCRKAGSFQFSYNYRQLEADAGIPLP